MIALVRKTGRPATSGSVTPGGVVAAGAPEVSFLAYPMVGEGLRPVIGLPTVAPGDVTGTGTVPERRRFRISVKVPVGSTSAAQAHLTAQNPCGALIDTLGLLPAAECDVSLSLVQSTDCFDRLESTSLIALSKPVFPQAPVNDPAFVRSGGPPPIESPDDPYAPLDPVRVPGDAVLIGNQLAVDIEGVGNDTITASIASSMDTYAPPDSFPLDETRERVINSAINLCRGQAVDMQIRAKMPDIYGPLAPGTLRVRVTVDPAARAGDLQNLLTDEVLHVHPFEITSPPGTFTGDFSICYLPEDFTESPGQGYEELVLRADEFIFDQAEPNASNEFRLHVGDQERVVSVRIVASRGLGLTEAQKGRIRGAVNFANIIHRQSCIRFHAPHPIEEIDGLPRVFESPDLGALARERYIQFRDEASETTSATIFIVDQITRQEAGVERHPAGIAPDKWFFADEPEGEGLFEFCQFACIDLETRTAGQIGETLAHELAHVLAAFSDLQQVAPRTENNLKRLMWSGAHERTMLVLTKQEVYILRNSPDGMPEKRRFFIR